MERRKHLKSKIYKKKNVTIIYAAAIHYIYYTIDICINNCVLIINYYYFIIVLLFIICLKFQNSSLSGLMLL